MENKLTRGREIGHATVAVPHLLVRVQTFDGYLCDVAAGPRLAACPTWSTLLLIVACVALLLELRYIQGRKKAQRIL